MRICIPVLMGLEAVVGREIEALGYGPDAITKQDGQVFLEAPQGREALSKCIADLNVHLASGERVLLEVGRGDAYNFDQLFELTQLIPWERFIPEGYPFVINGYTRNSELQSIPACQRTIKKAQVIRLREARGFDEDQVLEENSEFQPIRIQFSLMNNEVSFRIDTTGAALHKRGYRLQSTEAPIKETLAAAMLELSRWVPFGEEGMWDPFCGSGTLIIEAAMKAAGIAPGCRRRFSGEFWPFLDPQAFEKARREARTRVDLDPPARPFLIGTDIDPEAIEIARINAKRAGVEDFVNFDVMDIADGDAKSIMSWMQLPRLMIMSNPPYGERISTEEDVVILNRFLGAKALAGPKLKEGVRLFVITADENFERQVGARADKRRKLYNGMIKCTYYQYFKKPLRSTDGRAS